MQDFRIDRKKQHLLADIITIAIAAALYGTESYSDIEDLGVVRENWLKTFLELPTGILSHDTLTGYLQTWIRLNLKHVLGTG